MWDTVEWMMGGWLAIAACLFFVRFVFRCLSARHTAPTTTRTITKSETQSEHKYSGRILHVQPAGPEQERIKNQRFVQIGCARLHRETITKTKLHVFFKHILR